MGRWGATSRGLALIAVAVRECGSNPTPVTGDDERIVLSLRRLGYQSEHNHREKFRANHCPSVTVRVTNRRFGVTCARGVGMKVGLAAHSPSCRAVGIDGPSLSVF